MKNFFELKIFLLPLLIFSPRRPWKWIIASWTSSIQLIIRCWYKVVSDGRRRSRGQMDNRGVAHVPFPLNEIDLWIQPSFVMSPIMKLRNFGTYLDQFDRNWNKNSEKFRHFVTVSIRFHFSRFGKIAHNEIAKFWNPFWPIW